MFFKVMKGIVMKWHRINDTPLDFAQVVTHQQKEENVRNHDKHVLYKHVVCTFIYTHYLAGKLIIFGRSKTSQLNSAALGPYACEE